ncbi:SufD family Fe-S cluster assembly protein [Candidatus Woesebacteria bacterium]|nr:SufD family Fe-S cluster assembly protein [Candidatus Woesebacteria bacterium]
MEFIDLRETTIEKLTFNKSGGYVVFMHNRSGKYTFDIITAGVELYILGLFEGKTSDDYHVETIQHHTAPGSISDLFIKGVFEDDSRFVYQGLIRLEKEAQQSHAYQKNQNLILSPSVFVDSRPFLEILANDVFCTHGSTTGKLNRDQLLYAQMRGLSSSQAQQMLVEGFKQEVYDRLEDKVRG